MRHNGPRDVDLAPPMLILLYHVEKTGGSTVKEWLLRNVKPIGPLSRRLDAVINYPDGVPFLCSEFETELECRRSRRPRKARPRNASDYTPPFAICTRNGTVAPWDARTGGMWRQLRVAVELHAGI